MKKYLYSLAFILAACAESPTDSNNTPPPAPNYEPSSSSIYVAPSSSSVRPPEPSSSSATPSSSSVYTAPSSSSQKSTTKTIDDYIDEYCTIEAQCMPNNYDNCKGLMNDIINRPQNEGKLEERIKAHINNIQNLVDNNCGL